MDEIIAQAVQRCREKPTQQSFPGAVKRPSATWTYIVQDTPFDDQLAVMLLDNSNIGFQVDFLSALLLAILSFFKGKKRKRG